MPRIATPTLQPRKTPVQARSAASVDAILEAAIQVLAQAGREQFTTTRVAARAGVSVGTLYQYFPNKRALLQGALERHMTRVGDALEAACAALHGHDAYAMADGLIRAYLHAKMEHVPESAALYAVAADLDGASARMAAAARSQRIVAGMFATVPEPLTKDSETVATVVMAALNGVARRILEAEEPAAALHSLSEELRLLVHGYLRQCSAQRF